MHEKTINTDFYWERGYCQIRPIRRGFLEDVSQAAETFDQIIRNPVNGPFVQGFGNKDGKFRQLRYLHYRTDAFRRLMQSEEIRAITRCVFGSRRMFVTHSKVSHKEFGHELEWFPHQDSAYKLLHNLPARDGMTIAVFLEDADERSGTIQVFPGSHKLRTLPHSLQQPEHEGGSGQLVVQVLPNIEAESVIAKKGDILVFTFDTIHQSQPNQSHGYRPVFLFEIKPHKGFPLDERGLPPIIINGKLAPAVRVIYPLVATIRRFRVVVEKSRLATRLRMGLARLRPGGF